MEGGGWRGELDISFRQNVLNNVIMKALKECAQDSHDPNVLHKINDIVIKFEQRIFEKATSKDDYVAKIHQRLNQAKIKFVDVLTPPTGNQLTISMIQRQVNQSYHGQQNFNGTCLPLENRNMVTSMQHRETGIQPSFNGFNQDWQMHQQSAPIQNDFQQNMFNMDYRQRSIGVLNQVGNGLVSHMGSSSQLRGTFIDSQDRRNQFQAHGGMNTVDPQVLITQFQRMRTDYLPELIKFLDEVDVQNAHTRSIEQLQKSQKAKVVLGRMISFLQMNQREIMGHPKEKLIYHMNQITQFIRRTVKSNRTVSIGNQTLQFSASHHPHMDLGSSYPQSSASNSVPYGSCNKTQRVHTQSLLYQSPRATTDYSHHKLKQNLQLNSSSMNRAYLETLLSGTSLNSTQKKDDHSMLNPASGTVQHNIVSSQYSRNPPEGHPLPMKASQPIHFDQENDTSSFSNLRGTSLLKTSVFTLDSPSTPITPSSVSKAEGSVTPVISSEETKQLPLVEKNPIERLIRAVAVMSEEALSSSIDDIASVVSTSDRLTDPDFANFLVHNSRTLDCKIDGEKPIKIKRDITSLSGEAFTSPAKYCTKRLKIELNHDLLDEIKKINQKLIETIVELASDSTKFKASEGTIVRCTYKAVVLNETFKRHFAPATQVSALSVELLVPLDYPNSPPRFLDTIPRECRIENEDLTEKAKSRFNHSMRGFNEVMSLGEMARVWNDCARSVVSEFGCFETFSSKYDSWECVPSV